VKAIVTVEMSASPQRITYEPAAHDHPSVAADEDYSSWRERVRAAIAADATPRQRQKTPLRQHAERTRFAACSSRPLRDMLCESGSVKG